MKLTSAALFVGFLITSAAQAQQPPGPIAESWVQPRVDEARTRLNSTEAGRLVWAALEAHGGLDNWYQSGTLAFDFDYAPVDNPDRRMYTRQQVDIWSSRARHQELGEGADATFGYDGETAWMQPNADAFPSTAHFWSLTPYYFVGIPFVAADPGTILTTEGTVDLDGRTYNLVRLAYHDGTGDSPDDYYILYLDAETNTLGALRYVVSYPARFEEGEHSPEKLMRYGDYVDVNGILMPTTLATSTYDPETGEDGDVVTNIAVDNYTFGETWEATLFATPDAAFVETH